MTAQAKRASCRRPRRYSDPGCGRLNDLQELSKTHDMVSRAKTELWHRLLTHYLPLYFPEAERFQGNSRSDWFLALLEQFPTPASITALSKDAFVEAAWEVLAGRSPRHACWPISTRRRGRPWHCRYGEEIEPAVPAQNSETPSKCSVSCATAIPSWA